MALLEMILVIFLIIAAFSILVVAYQKIIQLESSVDSLERESDKKDMELAAKAQALEVATKNNLTRIRQNDAEIGYNYGTVWSYPIRNSYHYRRGYPYFYGGYRHRRYHRDGDKKDE